MTEESAPDKLTDVAIETCSSNIKRHYTSALQELLITSLLLALLLFTVYGLAKLQGEQSDTKKRPLMEAVERANFDVTRANSRVDKFEALLAGLSSPQMATTLSVSPEEGIQRSEEKVRYEQLVEKAKLTLEEAKHGAAKASDVLLAHSIQPSYSEALLYGGGTLFVVLLGILTGLYRIHMREISKNEQYRLGLMRIRIAANNASSIGFDSEVRTALTKGAFDVPGEESLLARRGKVVSPLPGHPTSDLATSLLNRLLEQVEVVLQPKNKST